LCGGYQLLGRSIADPCGIDGRAGTVDGLGLLDIETSMRPDKTTTLVRGRHSVSGAPVEGYEIHVGRTQGPDCARPLLDLDGRPDGAMSANGRVQGCYVHGLFAGDAFRRAWLAQFDVASSLAYDTHIEIALDALADHLETHLDIDAMLAIARSR
jgi:adenosylcobyric acid synthase